MGNCHVADVVEARFSQIILYKKMLQPHESGFSVYGFFQLSLMTFF